MKRFVLTIGSLPPASLPPFMDLYEQGYIHGVAADLEDAMRQMRSSAVDVVLCNKSDCKPSCPATCLVRDMCGRRFKLGVVDCSGDPHQACTADFVVDDRGVSEELLQHLLRIAPPLD